VSVRLEAAGASGRPVFFSIREPWTSSGALPADPRNLEGAVWQMLLFLLFAAAGVALAVRNLRIRRVDLVGATRLAATLFVLRLVASALTADYPAGGPEFLILLTLLVAEALFLATSVDRLRRARASRTTALARVADPVDAIDLGTLARSAGRS
jgi:hypothetical protein